MDKYVFDNNRVHYTRICSVTYEEFNISVDEKDFKKWVLNDPDTYIDRNMEREVFHYLDFYIRDTFCRGFTPIETLKEFINPFHPTYEQIREYKESVLQLCN
mgnify:FL=1|tara:strand:+ start:20243 stop:20548 length:306 start_codon:yes stop_codon:yes gene_type:complete